MNAIVYVGDYIRSEDGRVRRVVDICEDCFGEMMVILEDSGMIAVDDIDAEDVLLESEVNI